MAGIGLVAGFFPMELGRRAFILIANAAWLSH